MHFSSLQIQPKPHVYILLVMRSGVNRGGHVNVEAGPLGSSTGGYQEHERIK